MENIGRENVRSQRLLNIEEMAGYLGIKVNTLYSWTHTRKIPYIKVGHLVKFNFQEVVNWLSQFKVKTWEEEQRSRRHAF